MTLVDRSVKDCILSVTNRIGKSMSHPTVMMYSFDRLNEVNLWLYEQWKTHGWSIRTSTTPGGTARCIIVEFEDERLKTLFDLAWSDRVDLYQSYQEFTVQMRSSIRSSMQRRFKMFRDKLGQKDTSQR